METKVNQSKRRREKRDGRAANGAGTLIKHGKFYHARWRVNGKLISKSLHTADRNEAIDALARLSVPRAGQDERQTLRKIAQVISSTMSDVPAQMKLVSIPVRDLFKLFRDAPNRPSISAGTLHSYMCQFDRLADWMRAHHPEIVSARDVSQQIADEYAAHRAATVSPNTHNKDLNLFAQCWRILSPRFGLEYNPWTEEHITRLKLTPQRRRTLTPEECRAILAAATPEERTIIQIALFTGLRLGDVVRLRWIDIDLDRKWITRTQHKTNREVAIPIIPKLATALEKWRATSDAESEYVFPDQITRLRSFGGTENISRTFRHLFARAGIKQPQSDGRTFRAATFHSLRHTFVSSLIEAGVNPLIVKEAAGHSVMATTAGYTHIAESTLRKAIAKAAK